MSIEYTACKQKLTISLAVFAKIKKARISPSGCDTNFPTTIYWMQISKLVLYEEIPVPQLSG